MISLFNDGWKFKKVLTDGTETDWQSVDLPHDWQIYDTSNLYEDSDGWYKKTFDCTGDEVRTFIRFDGVYMDTAIWVNDEHVFDWKYGYSSFEFEITDYIHAGENEIKVRSTYRAPNSRWYSGAGIYRNVWIITKPASYIVPYGAYIHTEKLADGRWQLHVSSETVCSGGDKADISYSIYDMEGNEAVPSFTDSDITIDNITVWDTDNPYLYTLKVNLLSGGRVVDSEDVLFGFRTIKYDTEQGFFLNGRHIKLKGVCMHHDNGCLGAAANKKATERQFEILRDMGVNAIRTAHNMPDPYVMELAAKTGMLIVSEAFDMWERNKTEYDYARFFTEWYKKDVASWIRRDRNNPAVIMWSIGNEIYDTHADDRGQVVARMLMDEVYRHDMLHNAEVTIGSNYMPWENAQKCADIVKLAGYNYAEDYYEKHHRIHPEWLIYGSETGSVVSSRGIYHFPAEAEILSEEDLQCSSLLNSTTSWGARSVEKCIADDRDAKFSAGMFVWSGFDYIGEPTPYHTRSSYFGQIDTAGFPKDSFYVYKAAWTDFEKETVLHIFPYWDFNPGQIIDVMIVSNAPFVELFVNDVSYGKRAVDILHDKRFIARWKVPYEEGHIKAVAYDKENNIIAQKCRHSFGDAESITLIPDKTVMKADGEDVIFVTVSVCDKDGYTVENANNRMHVSVSGAGRLIGIDNGDSTDLDGYKCASKRLFSGKLLCIIAAKCEPGEIDICVSSEGLPDEHIKLEAVPSAVRAGISANGFIQADAADEIRDDIPVRKIELMSEGSIFNEANTVMDVRVKIKPENAVRGELTFLVTDDNGVVCNIAEAEYIPNRQAVRLTALGDGTFRLKAVCKNGTGHADVISQKEYNISGLGKRSLDPYGFIYASQYSKGSDNLTCGNEKGIATPRDGKSYMFFEALDFGGNGSDKITIPIFELENAPLVFEIWEGMPYEEGSTKLLDASYEKPSIWNTYQEETFTLNKKLKGITSLGFSFSRKAHIKGFAFSETRIAYEKNYVSECENIYGDTYERKENAVCGIGNNVTFAYENVDFSDGVKKLVICGRTELDNNTVHVRFRKGDVVVNKIIEFSFSEQFTERIYDICDIGGMYDEVTFIFLPGCKFDFSWFKFLK